MGRLDRSPKSNWVEKAGGLPSYIERIATRLHEQEGMPISRAIAVAVNTVKRWAVAGSVTKRGGPQVTAKTRAKAVAAVAEWEAKKASTKIDLAQTDNREDAAANRRSGAASGGSAGRAAGGSPDRGSARFTAMGTRKGSPAARAAAKKAGKAGKASRSGGGGGASGGSGGGGEGPKWTHGWVPANEAAEQVALERGAGYGDQAKQFQVAAVQARLVAQGYLSAASGKNSGKDGLFGPQTQTALKAFQKANRLPETGKVDRATAVALAAGKRGKPVVPAKRVAPAAAAPRKATAAPAVGAAAGAAAGRATRTPPREMTDAQRKQRDVRLSDAGCGTVPTMDLSDLLIRADAIEDFGDRHEARATILDLAAGYDWKHGYIPLTPKAMRIKAKNSEKSLATVKKKYGGAASQRVAGQNRRSAADDERGSNERSRQDAVSAAKNRGGSGSQANAQARRDADFTEQRKAERARQDAVSARKASRPGARTNAAERDEAVSLASKPRAERTPAEQQRFQDLNRKARGESPDYEGGRSTSDGTRQDASSSSVPASAPKGLKKIADEYAAKGWTVKYEESNDQDGNPNVTLSNGRGFEMGVFTTDAGRVKGEKDARRLMDVSPPNGAKQDVSNQTSMDDLSRINRTGTPAEREAARAEAVRRKNSSPGAPAQGSDDGAESMRQLDRDLKQRDRDEAPERESAAAKRTRLAREGAQADRYKAEANAADPNGSSRKAESDAQWAGMTDTQIAKLTKDRQPEMAARAKQEQTRRAGGNSASDANAEKARNERARQDAISAAKGRGGSESQAERRAVANSETSAQKRAERDRQNRVSAAKNNTDKAVLRADGKVTVGGKSWGTVSRAGNGTQWETRDRSGATVRFNSKAEAVKHLGKKGGAK